MQTIKGLKTNLNEGVKLKSFKEISKFIQHLAYINFLGIV